MTSATKRVSTWSYLCDTCDNLEADIGERDCGVTVFCKRHKGSGTCEDISTTHGLFVCSACGCKVLEEGVDFGGINFCPDCGKAVVE